MSHSLSIILPVCNAQDRVHERAVDLLEIASELTAAVELLIVDDGSSDDTEEVAMELCRMYPQIRILRRAVRRGVMAAAKAGIEQTTGDIVMIHDIESPLSSQVISQFWGMRDDEELVFARSEAVHSNRSHSRRRVGVTAWRGTQMLRRSAINELQPNDPPPGNVKIDKVTRTDIANKSVPLPNTVLQQLASEQRTQSN